MKYCSTCFKHVPSDHFARKKTDMCLKCYHIFHASKYRERNVTGIKKEAVVIKTRKCLMCDCSFESTGNRKCEQCNKESYSQYDSNISLFVGC